MYARYKKTNKIDKHDMCIYIYMYDDDDDDDDCVFF